MQKILWAFLVGTVCLFDTVKLSAQSAPQFRPALLAPGPRSLVELIDGQGLVRRKQGNGLIMFQCGVSQLGFAYGVVTYRETPDTRALRDEVLVKLDRAEFRPALVNGVPTAILLHGTVMFAVIDGKPRVRVFLNQEDGELKAGNDFIAPQLILNYGTKFKRIEWPRQAGGNSGTVSIRYSVSTAGVASSPQVDYEHPPRMGFASAVLRATEEAPFIPAFRNGRPVAASCGQTFLFRAGRGPSWKTG